MHQFLNATAHGVVGTVLIAIWFVPLFKITICDNFGKDIRSMRITKSSSLKQKRANKHLRGIKNYTLSSEQKGFDDVSTFDMLFETNVKYRVFAILGGVSGFISLVLVSVNLFLGFNAYVIVNLVNTSPTFLKLVGVKEVSFMTVFESFYFGSVELMRDMFATIFVAIIVFSFIIIYNLGY